MAKKKEEVKKEPPKIITYPVTGTWYFAVIYLTDGTVHLWPGEDKEKCKELIKEISGTEYKERIRETRIVKRNLDNYDNGLFL